MTEETKKPRKERKTLERMIVTLDKGDTVQKVEFLGKITTAKAMTAMKKKTKEAGNSDLKFEVWFR